MDLAYWGCSHWPFQFQRNSNGPDVGASGHEAGARLLFLIDECRRGGFLSGAAGIGKTRLLRQIMTYASRHGRECWEIDTTGCPAEELPWQIAGQTSTDVPFTASISRCWSAIREHLADLALIRRPVVVFVDHWDQADGETGQTLRRLLNLSESQGSKLTLILASRDPFVAESLRDLIELNVELLPWSRHETAQFMSDSLRAAGITAEIFLPEAIDAIHHLAQGIPREVIRICDIAMLAAMKDDRRLIDSEIIAEAARELNPSHAAGRNRSRPRQPV